jgi:hypothetical protein
MESNLASAMAMAMGDPMAVENRARTEQEQTEIVDLLTSELSGESKNLKRDVRERQGALTFRTALETERDRDGKRNEKSVQKKFKSLSCVIEMFNLSLK